MLTLWRSLVSRMMIRVQVAGSDTILKGIRCCYMKIVDDRDVDYLVKILDY